MRPKGLGDLLILRQYEEDDGAADEGDSWPLEVESADDVRSFGRGDDLAEADLVWEFLVADLGLRLRTRERFSKLESEDEPSSTMALEERLSRAAVERVMGAK
jgi:hypothetical protein